MDWTYFDRVLLAVDSNDLCELIQRYQVVITECNVCRRVSRSQNADLLLLRGGIGHNFDDLCEGHRFMVELRRA